MTYADKLKDPRWQERRLSFLSATGWKCQDLDCESPKTAQLHIHHCAYRKHCDPWDYPDNLLLSLCKPCHEKRQAIEDNCHAALGMALRSVPMRRLETVCSLLVSEAIGEVYT